MQAFEPRPEATVFRSVTYIPHTRKQGPLRVPHCLSCYQEGADVVRC